MIVNICIFLSYGGFLDKIFKRNCKNHLGIDLLGVDDEEILQEQKERFLFILCVWTVVGKIYMDRNSPPTVFNAQITVKCKEGPCIIYGHVIDLKNNPVQVNDEVSIGEPIANIGEIPNIPNDGIWDKNHLHLGVNTKCWIYYYHDYDERTGDYAGWGIATKNGNI